MRFHRVEILVFRQEPREMLSLRECVEVSEDGVSLYGARIFHAQVVRIGKHRHDFFSHVFRRVGQVDAVAERFAHFGGAVESGETHACFRFRQEGFRHDERFTVDRIKLVHNFGTLFKHGELIFAYGHDCRVKCRDVGRLADRVVEKTDGNARTETSHLNFRLDGRVALQPRDGDEVRIIETELRESRHAGLNEERRFLGIESGGKVVQSDFEDVFPYLIRIFGIVGQRLSIGDHDVNLIESTGILEFNASP